MSEKRNPVGAFIEEKLVPLSTGFAQNPYIRCIGSGSQSLMAIIMLGQSSICSTALHGTHIKI